MVISRISNYDSLIKFVFTQNWRLAVCPRIGHLVYVQWTQSAKLDEFYWEWILLLIHPLDGVPCGAVYMWHKTTVVKSVIHWMNGWMNGSCHLLPLIHYTRRAHHNIAKRELNASWFINLALECNDLVLVKKPSFPFSLRYALYAVMRDCIRQT